MTGSIASPRPLRVAVIGTGITGLAAASTLWKYNQSNNQPIELIVYEKDSHIGGHANTQRVHGVDVDIGFMVCNAVTYPNMLKWFEEHGIELEKSDMSLAVSINLSNNQSNNQSIEWSSNGLSGVFADKTQLVNPSMYQMINDMVRFKKDVVEYLDKLSINQSVDESLDQLTLGQFLSSHNYSQYFIDFYLLPVCSSIWSINQTNIQSTPASFILSFLFNHHLLQLINRPQWLTVKDRSHTYVEKVTAPFKHCVRLNCGVESVKVIEQSIKQSNNQLELTLSNSDKEIFDAVIMASHAPDSLKMINQPNNQSINQMNRKSILGSFVYQPNDIVVHTDSSMMPKRKACWSAWNFIGNQSNDQSNNQSNNQTDKPNTPISLTYHLNRLQNLKTDVDIFVTLNPPSTIDQSKIVSRCVMDHPTPTTQSVKAADRLISIQGVDGMYFAGAWAGWGFHEDGFKSGQTAANLLIKQHQSVNQSADLLFNEKLGILKSEVAEMLKSSIPSSPTNALPEGQTLKHITVTELSNQSINQSINRSLDQTQLSNPKSFNDRIGMFSLASMARMFVLRFLNSFIKQGSLVLYEVGGSVEEFGVLCNQTNNQTNDESIHVKLRVHNPDFYMKIAARGDLGLADAYIDGDFTPSNNQALVHLFQLFVVNRDINQSINGGKLNMFGLLLASMTTSLTSLFQSVLKRNTVDQSRKNISEHYDTGNEFFKLFLDRSMTYSCAIFETPDQTLYDAQVAKVDRLIEKLNIQSHHRVLEIGSGWGFLSRHIARRYGCSVTAITLSHEQLALCRDAAIAEKLDHLCKYELVDYRVFGNTNKDVKFDRIVSCEMLEAVGHEYFGDFYSHCDRLLSRDGLMSVQVIAFPDNKYDEYRTNIDFIRERIFPGGLCPSLTALTTAMSRHSTLLLEQVINIGPHYAPTLEMWRRNLSSISEQTKQEMHLSEPVLRKWDYYFAYCEAGFRMRTLNVYHLLYTRASNLTLDTDILKTSASHRQNE